jgi:hypothetical protein
MNGLLQSLLRPQRRSFLLIHDCFHLSSTNVVSWTGSNICLDPDVNLVQYDIDPCTTSIGKFTVGDTAPHVRGPVHAFVIGVWINKDGDQSGVFLSDGPLYVRGIGRHDNQNESSCHSMGLNKRRSRCCRPVDLWSEASKREPLNHSEHVGSHMTTLVKVVLPTCAIAFGVEFPDMSILWGRVLDFDLADRSVSCDTVLDIELAQVGVRCSTRGH